MYAYIKKINILISEKETLESLRKSLIKNEEKIAHGLLMKAIDSELIYQEGLKKNITPPKHSKRGGRPNFKSSCLRRIRNGFKKFTQRWLQSVL